MQNKLYSEKWAISQSMLKAFKFQSPKKWYQIHIEKNTDLDKKEEGFIFGDLVDTLLFSEDLLEERFFIGVLKLPSPAIAAICKSCYNHISTNNLQLEAACKEDGLDLEKMPYLLEAIPDYILQACNEYEYQDGDEIKKGWNNGWKPETRVKKILDSGSDYFDNLVECEGRKIVTETMNFEAIELKDILQKDVNVKKYFIAEENVELKFQFEIFVDHTLKNGNKIPLKGALDILRIDHNYKTIQIVDFKTSYSAFEFVSSIKKYGYATQLSFYDHLLRLWLEEECKGKFCEYTILNPINIVIDKYDKVPYIYEYSWQDLNLEREGNEAFLEDLYHTSSHNNKIKKGWLNILEDVAWHYFNEYWERSRELFENGKIKINLLTQ